MNRPLKWGRPGLFRYLLIVVFMRCVYHYDARRRGRSWCQWWSDVRRVVGEHPGAY